MANRSEKVREVDVSALGRRGRKKKAKAQKPPISRTHVEISAQWDMKKNVGFSPDDVTYGSHSQVWWRCDKQHSWQASVKARTILGSGCPRCQGIETDLRKYPESLSRFDNTKNVGFSPFSLSPRKKVWWQCTEVQGHNWFAAFDTLTGAVCPLCTSKIAGFVSDDRKLKYEFHPTKNGSIKPRNLSLWSHKRVWWKCAKGPDHEWQTSVKDRTSYKTGCPFCSNKRVSVTNSLARIAPSIAREWHPKKNFRTPKEVVANSMTKYWFVCKNGHEYLQTPFSRVNLNRGCGTCYRNRGSMKERL